MKEIGRNYNRIIVILLIFSGLALRLYGINLPLLDSHQIRQTQTAMMARNIYYDNMNIFRTRLDIFGDGTDPVILEFPLMHGISAFLYNFFGVHEVIGRLVNLVFSIGAMVVMYCLARCFLPATASFGSLALFAFSPMNIYFSRAYMPESSMMFFSIAALYFFFIWLERQNKIVFLFSLFFAAFVCLIKPNAGLIFVPIFSAWFLKKKWAMLKSIDFWIYSSFAFIPIIIWAVYAHYMNAQNSNIDPIFGGSWLKILTDRGGIFCFWISPKFYFFIGGSLFLLLLTPLGAVGTIVGCFSIPETNVRKILFIWLLSIVAYFFVFSGANSDHIYYHLPLLPAAAILFGFALKRILEKKDHIERLKRKIFFISIVSITVPIYVFGYYLFFKYMYDTETRMPYEMEVAEIIKERTPENTIIVLYEPNLSSPVTLSYYSHRVTWLLDIDDIESEDEAISNLEKYRNDGAGIYATIKTKYGDGVEMTKSFKKLWEHLQSNYTEIVATGNYVLFDLTKCKK